MTIVDWRQVDRRALALVFARERARWLVDLGWETRESWTHVETARSTWGLPGLAAVDEGGRVRGLAFFHVNGSRVDLGGVFAESKTVREALLDRVIALCGDTGGRELHAFLYAHHPELTGALVRRGFDVEPTDYLLLSLEAHRTLKQLSDQPQILVRDWTSSDAAAVGSLLHRSYDATAARRFIGSEGSAGWQHYVRTLVNHGACGTLLPSCTRLAFVADALVGVVLVTHLGPATAHIAQVVVDPDWRRRGLAGELLDDAALRVRTVGYARVTLLSAATNQGAQTLYRDRGYVPHAAFLSAVKTLEPSVVARAS